MTEFAAFVDGRPAPKGSLEGVGAGRVRESNRASADWRAHVAVECRRLAGESGWQRLAVPVVVGLRFLFPRPAKPAWPVPATTETGDVDKLVRNVLDALSWHDKSCTGRGRSVAACRKHGGIYVDDALVVDVNATTRYASPWGAPGVFVAVRTLDLAALPRYGPLEAESLGETPREWWP